MKTHFKPGLDQARISNILGSTMTKLTPEQNEQVLRTLARGVPKESINLPRTSAATKARAGMNKTERLYSLFLNDLKTEGGVLDWRYEAVKLKLAEGKCFYTPDFLVVCKDGSFEFHEVKGFWRDDARVKIKVAATMFPWFRFVAAQKVKGGWSMEQFNGPRSNDA